MRPWHIRTLTLVPALLVALAAGTGRVHAQSGTPTTAIRPAGSPAEVVEQFMQMATAKNYGQMGYVFGTREGAVINRDPRADVERRMFAIASILQNQRFVVRDQNSIPGRPEAEAVQLTVQLTQDGHTKDVPFVAVRTTHGAWLVEQVDLEKLTRVF